MNRRNGHMRYRRSVYRKNRIKFVVIASLICLVVVALIFLIVGNALGNKVEENVTSRKDKQTATEAQPHKDVKSVRAFPVPLSDNASKLSDRLGAASAAGYTDICFNLDSSDGTLLYSSEIAQELGKQSSGAGLWKLGDAVEQFKENGLYSIAIIHITDFTSDDDLVRSAAAGYYSALIAEAIRAGVDDVLIFVGELPTERYTELINLASEVRRLCPDNGNLGLSLSVGVLSNTDNAALFDSLWSSFDYIAADLTAPPEGVGNVEHIDASLGKMLYYLLRYNIRVLLPSADESALSAMETAVANNGSENIQIMPN